MIAQIYSATDGKSTSVVVSNNKGDIYYHRQNTMSELMELRRAVAFVHYNLKVSQTELYPDKMDAFELVNDSYVQHCNIYPVVGDSPNEYAQKLCQQNLRTYNRWNILEGSYEM